MAVTLDDIATRLGVATPTNDSPEGKQWLAWIGDATLLVRLRAESLGLTLEGLDPEALDWLALIGGETEQVTADNRRIVWMRAEGHRWKQICRAVGCVRSTAWRRWTAALVTIANRLNKQRKTSRRPHSAKTSGDARGAKRDGEAAKGPP